MISIETEARVAKILLAIADGEKCSEAFRQRLAHQIDFDPYNIFRMIDKSFNNYIDEYDILSFLKLLSVFPSISDVRNLISVYDYNMDGNLNYDEFLNFIITDMDLTLRGLANQKSSYYPNRSPFIKMEIENSLVKLFESEFDLLRELCILQRELSKRYDYDPNQMFSLMDEFTLNYISLDNLKAFLFKNGVDLFESEYKSIFKRLDIDRDGRVSFREFKNIFSLGSVIPPIHTQTSNLNKSLNSTRREILNASNNFGSSLRLSPSKISAKQTYLSPLREKNNSNLNLSRSYNRDVSRTYHNDFYNNSLRTTIQNKFNTYEEDLFLSYIKDTLINERELERVKCDLTLKADFNLSDLYKIFEVNKLGYLTASDLKNGMSLFNVFATIDEVNLLIKRYDGSNTISSFAFNKMILPVDREYNRILRNRVCLDYHPKCTPDVFSFESRYSITNLLKTLLNAENNSENWRQKFYNLKTFKSIQIYEKFDTIGKNYINSNDLISTFKINSVFFSLKDIELLFFKFDKNNDERISFKEFVDELIPKSTEYVLRNI